MNTEDETSGVTFNIFDSNDVMLGSVTKTAMFTLYDGVNNSSFPEAFVEISFSGVASYATFDFDDVFDIY